MLPGERDLHEGVASLSPRLRAATVDDIEAVLGVAIASTLFAADEVAGLREPMEAVLEGRQGPDHQIALWTDTPDDLPAGAVYFGSDPMTDRKWDLWMIAVNSDRQGQGIGGELLRYVESRVRAAGGRLLLIETSSLPKFDPTRAFYARHGYHEIARIPDFYADGDSKVIVAKRIDA